MRPTHSLRTVTALLLVAAPNALAQRGASPCDVVLGAWLSAAPFSVAAGPDYIDVGNPASLAPRAGDAVAGKTWQQPGLNTQGRLDLGSMYTNAALTNAAIYAATYLGSPARRAITIGVEGGGPITMWLNGRTITPDPPAAGARPGMTEYTLNLEPGVNRLLYKLVNRSAAPGMSARMLAKNRDAYGDIVVADRPDVTVSVAPDAPSGFRIGPALVGDHAVLAAHGSLYVPMSVCAARGAADPTHAILSLGASHAAAEVESTTVHPIVGGVRIDWADLALAVLGGRPALDGALVAVAGADQGSAPPERRGRVGLTATPGALLELLSKPIATTGWVSLPTSSFDVGTPLSLAPADSDARRALAAIGFKTTVPFALAGLTLQLEANEFLPKAQIFVGEREVRPDSMGRVIVCERCAEGATMTVVIRLNGAKWWDPPILRVADLGWREISDGALWARFFTRDSTIPMPSDSVASRLAYAALSADKTEYRAIVDHWLTILAPAAAIIRRDTIDIVGNSHIDAAWQWRWRETQDVVNRTWSTATKLMAKYPDMHFAASAAVYYDWVEAARPDLLQRIKELEREGRWDVVGGWWLEPDVEMPSGESLVRQALYGQREFTRLFGHPARVAWIPDSFGFPYSLPQILMKSGTDFFVTQKVRWNTTNTWPATLNQFWWQGVDGTRIFTDIPYGYSHDLAPRTLATQMRSTRDSSAMPKMLTLYGVGDHGGGPTMAMLENSHDLKRIPTFPVIRDASPVQALSRMRDAMPKLPVVDDELYPEFHRGVWVSQAAMKTWNRYLEGFLGAADAAATVAPGVSPRDDLTKAWKSTLFNQFHDLLPGSGITPIYSDAKADYYRPAESMVKKAFGESMAALTAPLDTRPPAAGMTSVAVFNPSAFERSDVVELDTPGAAGDWSAVDAQGKALPTMAGDSLGRVLVRVEKLAPLSTRVIFLRHTPPVAATSVPGALVLENRYLRAEVDQATGAVARLYDKEHKREVLRREPGTSDLVLLYDNPKRQDAWEVDDVQGARTWITALAGAPRPEVHREAFGQSLTVQRGRDSSIITQRYVLDDSARRLDIETTVDWKQAHHLLDAVFPLAFHIDSAYAEIPYAVIARPTRFTTRVDSARFFDPMLRFVDGSSRDYGVAIEANGKSGYHADGDTLFLSLLRAPKSPDAVADMEVHHFRYSIVPHAGDWRAPEVLGAARSLNQPLRGAVVPEHAGTGRATAPAFTITGGSVDLGTLKRAEDSDAWVVRLVETSGRATTATIRFAAPPGAGAEDADLLERPTGKKFAIVGGVLRVPMAPWEIKTLVIRR